MRNKIPCQALKGMSSILLQGLSVHKGRSLRESRHLESSILKCSHVPRRLFHASRRCFPEQQRSTLKKFKVLWSKGGGRGKLHCLGYKKNKDKRCKKKKKKEICKRCKSLPSAPSSRPGAQTVLSSGAREMPAHMACTGAVTQHCMLYRQDHTQIQQHTAMAHEVNASTALLQPSNCATSLSSSIPLWHPTSPLLAHGLKLQRIVMRVTVFLKILIGLSRQSPNKILWRVTATGQRTNGEGTLTTLLHICFPNLIS